MLDVVQVSITLQRHTCDSGIIEPFRRSYTTFLTVVRVVQLIIIDIHSPFCCLYSGALVVYTLRVNMSVAAPKMRDSLGWTEAEKGFVLVSESVPP